MGGALGQAFQGGGGVGGGAGGEGGFDGGAFAPVVPGGDEDGGEVGAEGLFPAVAVGLGVVAVDFAGACAPAPAADVVEAGGDAGHVEVDDAFVEEFGVVGAVVE